MVRNPLSYGFAALGIMIRTFRDQRPLAFFGTLGTMLFLGGFIPGLWLFIRWLLTGMISPYASLVTLSAVLMIMGFITIMLALLADMQGIQRKMLDEILYEMRRSKSEPGEQQSREAGDGEDGQYSSETDSG